MILPEEIKRLRTRCFLTQEDFAKKLGVAFSTVNRWEQGKSKPNLVAMKNIKARKTISLMQILRTHG